MLPTSLRGPEKVIYLEPTEQFLSKNMAIYPNLDRDFILQICFEHPNRFDDYFPGFDPILHSAIRKKKPLSWLYENVRYDDNEKIDFWYTQFDQFREDHKERSEIFSYMIENGTWSFPPVIIENKFGKVLNSTFDLGEPYHLIEGTHRVSYARRMLELGLVQGDKEVEIIEVEEKGRKNGN